MIRILFTIFNAYVMYNIFNTRGLRYAIIFTFVYTLLYFTINNYGSNLGIVNSIFIFSYMAIECTATTCIDYLVFKKTNSFMNYLIVSIIVSTIAIFLLAYVISFLNTFIGII